MTIYLLLWFSNRSDFKQDVKEHGNMIHLIQVDLAIKPLMWTSPTWYCSLSTLSLRQKKPKRFDSWQPSLNCMSNLSTLQPIDQNLNQQSSSFDWKFRNSQVQTRRAFRPPAQSPSESANHPAVCLWFWMTWHKIDDNLHNQIAALLLTISPLLGIHLHVLAKALVLSAQNDLDFDWLHLVVHSL